MAAKSEILLLKQALQVEMAKILTKGDSRFLVASAWFKKMQSYVGYLVTDVLGDNPGVIDNSDLLKPSSNIIKDCMVEKQDYILVPEIIWNLLVKQFGLKSGQEPIARKVIELGMFVKRLEVEVYFVELQVSQFSDMGSFRRVTFSRNDKLGEEVLRRMKDIFCLNSVSDADIKLIAISCGECYELHPSENVWEAGLVTLTRLVIVQRVQDGSWPTVSEKDIEINCRFADKWENIKWLETKIVDMKEDKQDHEKKMLAQDYEQEKEALQQHLKTLQRRHHYLNKRLTDKHKKQGQEREKLKVELKNQVRNINSSMVEKQKLERAKLQMDLKSKVKDLDITVNDGTLIPPTPHPFSVPECPVCLEAMLPPKNIFNCANGHLVCSDCRKNVERCPTCKQGVTGRATCMEQHLIGLFKKSHV